MSAELKPLRTYGPTDPAGLTRHDLTTLTYRSLVQAVCDGYLGSIRPCYPTFAAVLDGINVGYGVAVLGGSIQKLVDLYRIYENTGQTWGRLELRCEYGGVYATFTLADLQPLFVAVRSLIGGAEPTLDPLPFNLALNRATDRYGEIDYAMGSPLNPLTDG